jgi:hypothetical protein
LGIDLAAVLEICCLEWEPLSKAPGTRAKVAREVITALSLFSIRADSMLLVHRDEDERFG